MHILKYRYTACWTSTWIDYQESWCRRKYLKIWDNLNLGREQNRSRIETDKFNSSPSKTAIIPFIRRWKFEKIKWDFECFKWTRQVTEVCLYRNTRSWNGRNNLTALPTTFLSFVLSDKRSGKSEVSWIIFEDEIRSNCALHWRNL